LGAIAAVFAKRGEDANALTAEMLRVLCHRGTNTRTLKINGAPNSFVGYAAHLDPAPHVFESDGKIAVIEGSIFRTPRPAKFAGTRLSKGHNVKAAARTLVEEPGAFACVFSRGESAYIFRDLNGMKPLYYGRSRGLTAFASERKALWRIGLKNPARVIPGHLYTVNESGVVETHLSQFPRPTEGRMALTDAATRLAQLLSKSIGRMTRGIDKLAVAFSGGIDSALAAALAKRTEAHLEAVSAGLPGSSELSTVEKWAQELDLPITVETFQPETLETYVRRVIWLIEEPSLMKVSVAVPLHWAAMVAARRGFNTMLCGQGSDELYGGYSKYARTLAQKGRSALSQELYESLINSAQVNYERDDQATSPFGVELRTPYADLDVIKFSLTIPSEFKVKGGDDTTRKWVLRSVAKDSGLPDEIVWRRKKAIQHGTGVENAIRKIAKQHGVTVNGYLSKVYEEVSAMGSMP
jgi:asparagine synthase (glutamine-hydrolysing)